MKKTNNILFIIIFLLLCSAPLIGWILGYENANAEKRTLSMMPKLIVEDGINTDFTVEFDDYYTDNFAFRSDLITLHAALEAAVFSESVSDQVVIGKDGWLYFTPTLDDFKKDNVLDDSEIYKLAKTLEIQKEALNRRGIDFVFTVAPNKASIYPQFMPDRYQQVTDQSNVEKLHEVLNERGFDYVDLYSLLYDSDIQLYHKLDTHWNNTGAIIGFSALMDKVKETHPEFTYHKFSLQEYTEQNEWHGDLAGMLFPSAELLDVQNIYDYEKIYTSLRLIKSMEDMTIKTTCETGSLNMLMFRDSFANALIPLMSNEFAYVTYSRATPYNYLQMDDNTDVVILQIVERNLGGLLDAAPILPAYSVSLDSQITREDIETSLVTAEDEGGLICISGTAIPKDYSTDTNYDIYVRISSDEGDMIYPAFPMPESPDDIVSDGMPFCVRIEKSMMSSGDYTADIILFDQSKYISGLLLSSKQINSQK